MIALSLLKLKLPFTALLPYAIIVHINRKVAAFSWRKSIYFEFIFIVKSSDAKVAVNAHGSADSQCDCGSARLPMNDQWKLMKQIIAELMTKQEEL